MAYKEGSGIKFEVEAVVKDGRIIGKIVCQKMKDGKPEDKPLTELVNIPGSGETALSILGGRLKVDFMEAFNCFHE